MKIAIAGYGVEGQASYRYYSKDASNDITIHDQNTDTVVPDGVPSVLGADAFKSLDGYDLVLRSPAVRPDSLKTDGKVWSGTNEFFAQCPAEIIGVTGSKGKGTTSSMIASILEAAGRKVWLVGNIGVPPLDVLDQVTSDNLVVMELSSFQLWDLEYSPQTAVVLFIEQEHLDVHTDMFEYVTAKSRIAASQQPDDLLIYNAQNEYASIIASGSHVRKVGFPSEKTAHIHEGYFYNYEQKLCSVNAVQLPGEHNQSNAIAAIDAVWQYTQDSAAIESGLRAFTGLPHRLMFVREHQGISYYDDSIATTPGSAVAAIASFEQPKVIILGGSDKGADYQPLRDAIIASDSIRAVISIGANGAHITDALPSELVHRVDATDILSIVTAAAAHAEAGDVVIMSPAAASFDMFKSYADRGDQFIAAVRSL
jgi:UDP-N-acetylmuramoylalanine--D-glutamate ligase